MEQSDCAGAEKEAGSADAGEGQGGEEAEHSKLGPKEPREDEQRGRATAPHPPVEPGSAVWEREKGKGNHEYEVTLSNYLNISHTQIINLFLKAVNCICGADLKYLPAVSNVKNEPERPTMFQ